MASQPPATWSESISMDHTLSAQELTMYPKPWKICQSPVELPSSQSSNYKPVQLNPIERLTRRETYISDIFYEYLKFGAVLCTIPHQVTYNNESYRCSPHSGMKKVVVVVLNLAVDAATVLSAWTQLSEIRNMNPAAGLVIKMTSFVWYVYYFACKYILYSKRVKLEETLNRLSWVERRLVTDFSAKPPADTTIKILKICFVANVLVVVAAMNGIAFYQYSHRSSDSPGAPPNITISNSSDQNITELRSSVLLATTILVGEFLSQFTFIFAFQLCLPLATITWLLANTFMKHLKRLVQRPIGMKKQGQIVDLCNEMIDFSEALEEAVGVYIFAFCFALLPYYCVQLVRAFTKNWMMKIQIGWFIFVYICSLSISADANAIMKEFSSQLLMSPIETVAVQRGGTRELEEEVYQVDRLRILLHRISNNGYGIKGLAFTITYGFVGNLASLILTYSIIVIQFQGGREGITL